MQRKIFLLASKINSTIPYTTNNKINSTMQCELTNNKNNKN